MKEYSFADFVGKKVLIKGEVGVGKTRLLESLLYEANTSKKGTISLIDMAPEALGKGRNVGGRVSLEGLEGVRVLRPHLVLAPRLQGRSREEVRWMAEENRDRLGALIDEFLKRPTPILFINDLTLYLHAGDLGRLRRAITSVETFIGNAYEGRSIAGDHGSGITRRERVLLKELESTMDRIITLPRKQHPHGAMNDPSALS